MSLETLDSVETTTKEEKILENTSSEVWKALNSELEMSSPDFVIWKIKELNPSAIIETDIDRSMIFSSVNIEKLVLPEWFYYNQKNVITNKYNTQSGNPVTMHVTIHVYPIEHYNPDFIQQK